MAYSVDGYGTYSGRPAYTLHLHTRRDVADPANNRSTCAWALYLEGGTQSYALGAFPWYVNIGGHAWSGTSDADMRGGTKVIAATSTPWFGHDGNGDLSMTVSASHGPAGIFGSASLAVAFYTDRLVLAPTPPIAGSLAVVEGSVTATTARITYSRGSGQGQGLYNDSVQWFADAAMTQLAFDDSAGGISQPGNILVPGTTYHVRARSNSAGGSSAWAYLGTVTTLAGLRVRQSNAYVQAGTSVMVNGLYRVHQPLVKVNGAYVAAV